MVIFIQKIRHVVVIGQTQKLKGFCRTWLGRVCTCMSLKADIIVYYLSHLSTHPPPQHLIHYPAFPLHPSQPSHPSSSLYQVCSLSLPPCNQAHQPLPIAFWVFLSSHHPGPLVSSSRLLTCLPTGEPQQHSWIITCYEVFLPRWKKAAGNGKSGFRARPGCCSHGSLSESFCLIKWGAEIGFPHLNAEGRVIATRGHAVVHKTHARGGKLGGF